MIKKIANIAYVLLITIILGNFSYAGDEKLVPLDLAEKVATHHALQIWGEVKLKEPVLYHDIEDNPAVYVFTIYKGRGSVPSDSKILEGVRRYRSRMLNVEATNTDYLSGYWKDMRDEKRFATVVVGASEEHMPIIMYYDGLPLHFVALGDAKAKAREALNVDLVSISRYIWEGMYNVFFEFSDNKGRSVMVSPYNFDVLYGEDFGAGAAKEPTEDLYLQKIQKCKKSWKRIKEVINYDEE